MGLLDSIEIVDADAEGREKKARALFMASFGTASPPMTAAALFLMFRFGIALVVGLGPLFILCLLFDQTKDLFRRWLYYGIGTASWLNYAMGKSNLLGANAEGLSSQAMQSGGIGLLLTLLLISVPAIAAISSSKEQWGHSCMPQFLGRRETTCRRRCQAFTTGCPNSAAPHARLVRVGIQIQSQ